MPQNFKKAKKPKNKSGGKAHTSRKTKPIQKKGKDWKAKSNDQLTRVSKWTPFLA